MDIIGWGWQSDNDDIVINSYRRSVIATINAILASSNMDSQPESLSDALNQLTKITTEWLALEERRWRQLGCTHFQAHRAGHRQLTLATAQFCFDATCGVLDVDEMKNFLHRWAVSHVLEEDKICFSCIMADKAAEGCWLQH